MKALIRKLVPDSLVERYWEYRRRRQIQNRSCEDVFTEVYQKNWWGGGPGEFYSGSGSSDGALVSPYVSAVSREAGSEGFLGRTFVDLGCGDFRVGEQLLPLCSAYVGVDVVRPLIERNQEKFGDAKTRFVHLDIVRDELPEGDVCFVRQVFQHLSNREICAVLPKLERYQWIFITEHYPDDGGAVKRNKDKVHGGDVRVDKNSGIYLSSPPFNLPEERLRLVLEVPGTATVEGVLPGVIRTFLYKPCG